jgi:hypothetical protein
MATTNVRFVAPMPCLAAMAIIATPINTLTSTQNNLHLQLLYKVNPDPKADEQQLSENCFSVRLFFYK